MRARVFAAAIAVALSTPLGVSDVQAAPRPAAVTPVVNSVALQAPAATGLSSTGSGTVMAAEAALGADIQVVGVTWQDGASGQVTVEVRHRTEGTWSAWVPLDREDALDASETSARAGTEPYVVVGAERVQARLSTAPGSAVVDPRLDVVDPGRSDADPEAGVTAMAETVTAAGAARPTVRSRAAWGADESLRRSDPSYSAVRAAVVHHTAGSNSYSEDQTPSVIRGIYAFHVQGRGWSDIGYNMLADKYGRLWEGRYGGIDRGVVGAHVSGYNTGSFGISVMGTYGAAAPPAATIDAVSRAIAWKLSLHGVSATDQVTLAGRSIPAVVGHRDLGSTECPGSALYGKLDGIRQAAYRYQAAGGGSTPPAPQPSPSPAPPPAPAPAVPLVHDLTGDRHPDMLTRTASAVRLSEGAPLPVQSRPTQIGTGWQQMDVVLGTADMSGDGHRDLLARHAPTGQLMLYHGNGSGGFRTSSVIGWGWNGMQHIVAPGDWTGDGRPDVLAVNSSDGKLYLYRGSGQGRFTSSSAIGHGWQGMTMLSAAGDLDGDGHPDVASVDGTGTLRLHSGNGRGGFLRATVIGSDWKQYDALTSTGDFDGDGRNDLVARAADGRMASFYGRGDGTFDPVLTWGNRWGGLRIVGSGDWDGDRKADLLGVNASTGALYLYRGLNARNYVAPRAVALSAADVREMFVVGDVDVNGRGDVITIDTHGRMFLSFVSGNGVVGARQQIGTGWQGMDLVAAGGDLNGDGVPDVVARNAATADLFAYPLTRAGRFGRAVQIGSGWRAFDVIIGVGPWDEDDLADIIARRASDGALFLYPGAAPGRLASPRQIGSRWQGLSKLIGVGDLDQDGNADILARTSDGTDYLYRGARTGGFLGSTLLQGIPKDGTLS